MVEKALGLGSEDLSLHFTSPTYYFWDLGQVSYFWASAAKTGYCITLLLKVWSLGTFGELLEMQTVKPHPDLLKQNLHFHEILRSFLCTLKFEKHLFVFIVGIKWEFWAFLICPGQYSFLDTQGCCLAGPFAHSFFCSKIKLFSSSPCPQIPSVTSKSDEASEHEQFSKRSSSPLWKRTWNTCPADRVTAFSWKAITPV